jgi:hypothetical protein
MKTILWKDADGEVLIFRQVKAAYAKLQLQPGISGISSDQQPSCGKAPNTIRLSERLAAQGYRSFHVTHQRSGRNTRVAAVRRRD